MGTRYFSYISDAKIDMLLPQVPSATKEEVAAELGFSVGLITGKVSSKTSTLDTRVARLAVVEHHLKTVEKIGTLARPASWINGVLSMSCLDLGNGCILYLGGGKSRICALAGSAKHLAGTAAPESQGVPFSFLPTIADHLSKVPERTLMQVDKMTEKQQKVALTPGVAQGVKAWAQVISWLWQNPEGATPQDIRFLAKRLASQSYGDLDVLLASPLYVELLG